MPYARANNPQRDNFTRRQRQEPLRVSACSLALTFKLFRYGI
jgi:hypothetical protein